MLKRILAAAVVGSLAVCAICALCQPAHAATWSKKSDVVQASCYGPYEGETITATGRRITNSTPYIAVPMGNIVSKSRWKKLSKAEKKRRFYYHQRIKLTNVGNGKSVTCYVEDCGGFAGCGGTYKGKYRQRIFDCTPYVFKKLGFNGLAFVRFQYEVGR